MANQIKGTPEGMMNKNKEDQIIYNIIRKKHLKLQAVSFKIEVTHQELNTMSDKRSTLKPIIRTI